MGQGHWIKENDGHYKHYTEEEYQNSIYGKSDRLSKLIVSVVVVVVVIIGVISLLVEAFKWFIGLFS